ncbi:MAG: DUF1015 domain-containing protein [Planctomycetes bacterium]|nr:DUF1015 domain-containing protein [Planctomycetota bacterium]
MAQFIPFNGLTYSDTQALPSLIAPPYDVIDDAEKENLRALSPQNVVHLILPDDDDDRDRYAVAASLFASMLADGSLRESPVPAFYVLEQEFDVAGRRLVRRAVFGALRLSPFGDGVVLPHEFTLSGPKEDRLRLISAVKANLSPVFGLVPDENGEVAQWSDLAVRSSARIVADGRDGVRNTFSAVTDPVMTARLTSLLENQVVLIADGHHRYETAINYRNRVGAGGDGASPADYVMIALVSMKDLGLVILPTHRVVYGTGRSAGLLDRLAASFEIHPAQRRGLEELARDQAHDEVGVIGYLGPEGEKVLHLRDASVVDACYRGMSDAYRSLDVAVLHGPILEKELGIDAQRLARKDNISYLKTVDDVYKTMAAGDHECAFVLRPTLMSEVLAVAKAGDRMPQKSTYFYPKLPSGLVIRKIFPPDAG